MTVDGYNIQDIALATAPAPPEWEKTYWYQYYFQSERGKQGLEENREALCELLWRDWSPTWVQAATAFPASAPSLHNPDFVEVVTNSYRHRFGLAAGDPQLDELERLLAESPKITVPAVVLEGKVDGVAGASAIEDREFFIGPYTHRFLPNVGHNAPQEDPTAFAEAVISLLP